MDSAQIFEIKGNSLDDGPGIRTVVFFKGCPLRCAWCHNPEGILPRPQLSFDADKCVGAKECLPRCPEEALELGTPGFVDRDRCTACFECVEACPSGALRKTGAPFALEEVLARVQRDLPFFQASGGGVTLSGGEPTMAMASAGALAERLRALCVNVLLETCGQFDLDRFDQQLYPFLDTIYFDLKLLDPTEHRRYCGADNKRILQNFEALAKRASDGGVSILPRIPLVPGMTATVHNLQAIAGYLRGLGIPKVVLLPYNPLWPAKARQLEPDLIPEDPRLTRWMKAEELSECERWFDGLL